MKKLLILLAVAAVAVACKKDDGTKGLDPNSKLYINGIAQVQKADAPQGVLSPLQVVEQAQEIKTVQWRMSIGDWNRDYTNVRFALGSDYIVDTDGKLVLVGIEARDYIFVTWKQGSVAAKDTVAYIPNKTMIEAEVAIRAAYARGDYDACNALFMKAFTFIPITGAKYLELQAKGEN